MSTHKWTKEEEQILINIYSDDRNDNISKILNIDIDKIKSKAAFLKLKKSKEQKSKNIATRNKLVGRDLSYENLKIIAKKYKTRGEFQRLDGSAYTVARISGYLDDICSHMMIGSYSIPQLTLYYIIRKLFNNDLIEYNCRTVINPYELDIYIDKYKIGFEYDGKLWHNDNKLDNIKNELCEKKNITLIRFKENNRNYSDDIKNQLIENIEIINTICNKNIKMYDIKNIDEKDINIFINNEIVDDDKIVEIISKYTNYHDFKTNESSLYQKLFKRGLIEKFTSHLKRDRILWTEELAKDEISKYEKLSDFIEKSNTCYNYVKRNKLNYLIVNLDRKYNTYTISDLENEISKYDKLSEFRKYSSRYYSYIKKHKLYYLIEHIKVTKREKD